MLQNVLLMGILLIPRRERWKWIWHFDKNNYMQYENPRNSEENAEWSWMTLTTQALQRPQLSQQSEGWEHSHEIVGGGSKSCRHFAGTCASMHTPCADGWKQVHSSFLGEKAGEIPLCSLGKNGNIPTDYIYTEINFQTLENGTDASFTPFSLAVFLITSASAWRQLHTHSKTPCDLVEVPFGDHQSRSKTLCKAFCSYLESSCAAEEEMWDFHSVFYWRKWLTPYALEFTDFICIVQLCIIFNK